MTGPELLVLPNVLELLAESGSNLVAAVANHDHRPLHSRLAHRPSDVFDHRESSYAVQALRKVGFHPSAFSGGKDDSGWGHFGHNSLTPTLYTERDRLFWH
jgi:hypothetical protein